MAKKRAMGRRRRTGGGSFCRVPMASPTNDSIDLS